MEAPPLVDTGLVSRLIGRALARGGTFAEVYVQRRRALGLELDDGEIRSSSSSFVHGVGIRVIRGAQVAYAHSDDLSEEALLACADAASRIGGDGSGDSTVVAKPLANGARARHADPKAAPSEVEVKQRLALLTRAHDAARAERADLEKVLGGYADVDEDVLIANSDGLLVTDRRVLCRLSLRVVIADEGGKKRVGSQGAGSRAGLSHYEEVMSPEELAKEAVRMATAQLGARPAPTGERTVVLGPSSSGVLLHEAVGHGLEADFIRKKSSLFSDKVGERVGSELCTVIDDGTLEGRRGSLNVDDEGTPTRENVLIEKGVLTGYMTDRLNADLMEMERTGNGRRQSFRHPPLPRMTNTFLAAGEDDPEEILKQVPNGLYCKAFGGGQVNIANGNFVFEVQEGYLIEDGKLTAPVQGATLVGSGPDVLGKVVRVGADAALDPGSYTCGKGGQSVPVSVGLPTIRIDGITVGGTGDAS
jgi:TldD protein